MSFRVKASKGGSAALRVSGRATVFASFERSCYVENAAGIACLGPEIGLGPLNMIVGRVFALGDALDVDTSAAGVWKPSRARAFQRLPHLAFPASIEKEASAFIAWLQQRGPAPDTLIGKGPGLTPAGDDFVGGAMIALRAFGHGKDADRVAAWALPLAETNTSRISRAHLACAAAGEGHEALHDLLTFADVERDLARLARIGHTSGTDAAAGALGALRCFVTDRLQQD